jgi:hypothetical protein
MTGTRANDGITRDNPGDLSLVSSRLVTPFCTLQANIRKARFEYALLEFALTVSCCDADRSLRTH